MQCYQEVTCPNCGSNRIIKAGKSTKGIQRYTCQNGYWVKYVATVP